MNSAGGKKTQILGRDHKGAAEEGFVSAVVFKFQYVLFCKSVIGPQKGHEFKSFPRSPAAGMNDAVSPVGRKPPENKEPGAVPGSPNIGSQTPRLKESLKKLDAALAHMEQTLPPQAMEKKALALRVWEESTRTTKSDMATRSGLWNIISLPMDSSGPNPWTSTFPLRHFRSVPAGEPVLYV